MKGNGTENQTLAICFGQFGPYHHARVAALQRAAVELGVRVVPVQIAAATSTYAWSARAGACEDLRTLCEGTDEGASPLDVFLKARKLFREEKAEVAFLPSYSPARFFALFAAAKSLGIRTVMMNESHAGTEQATGWKRWVKRQVVKRFDAALVGGEPHKRHFALLGIPADKIFTGYDAVDNALFAARADEVRSMERTLSSQRSQSPRSKQQDRPETEHLSTLNPKPSTQQSPRSAYGLPERYFLSLGRMVEKKNLATLVSAYARYAQGVAVAGKRLKVKGNDGEKQGDMPGEVASPPRAEGSEVVTRHQPPATRHSIPALVFVGSGELEGALKEQARVLGLTVIDRTKWKAGESSEASDSLPAISHKENCGTAFFYGFRQIEENPVFYSLAEAFVLPSLKEEWGLVVNEAMAAGLPVIVSRTAGCAEDLVPHAKFAKGAESGGLAATDGSLEQRSNGFVFDPKSCDALATALALVTDMGDRRSEMGQRSREIVAGFSCENFVRQALRAAEAAGE